MESEEDIVPPEVMAEQEVKMMRITAAQEAEVLEDILVLVAEVHRLLAKTLPKMVAEAPVGVQRAAQERVARVATADTVATVAVVAVARVVIPWLSCALEVSSFRLKTRLRAVLKAPVVQAAQV